eukprot:COSAG01_NODE_6605_length_3585_cov_2.048193_6_plen_83_part_00
MDDASLTCSPITATRQPATAMPANASPYIVGYTGSQPNETHIHACLYAYATHPHSQEPAVEDFLAVGANLIDVVHSLAVLVV